MFSANKIQAAFSLSLFVFRLLNRDPEPNKAAEDEVSKDDEAYRGRIRCPLCLWQPNASSRWYCASAGTPELYPDGCGTRWNTFETRGKCPGCSHQWRWTTCLFCHRESLHEDWYLKDSE